MNSPVLALRAASVLFGLIGVAHLIRILVAVNVTVGSWNFGRRWSALAVVVLAVLCGWLWRVAASAAKKAGSDTPPASA